jgi:predicted porin
MKSSILALTAATAMAAAPVMAGSIDAAPADPVPMAPVAPVAAPLGGDWTGAYAGLSLGRLDTQAAGTSETGGIYGLHAGYDYDFGAFVMGGEAEFQAGDGYEIGGVDVDNVTRLKLRAGYDAGRTLIYGTAGAARIDTSLGTANGPVGGVGVEYRLTDRFSIGSEALIHRFDDIGGSGVDADAQSYSLRGTLRF